MNRITILVLSVFLVFSAQGQLKKPTTPVKKETTSKPPVKVVERVKIVEKDNDKDNDGIIDSMDKCPDEWGEMKNEGCPEKAIFFKLKSVLKGHSSIVNSVAFNPDGSKIISGSNDKTLKVWNTATQSLVSSIEHNDPVYSVAYNPNGKYIVSGSVARIYLWYSNNGKLFEQKNLKTYVSVCSFNGSGTVLATSGDDFDPNIYLWKITDDSFMNISLIKTLSGHESYVHSIAFSPDGKKMISGSRDKSIKVWDVNSGSLLNSLNGHNGWVLSLAYSPDGSRIISGSSDMTLKVWDSNRGSQIQSINVNSTIRSAIFSSDGKLIIAGCENGKIYIWDASSFTLIQTIDNESAVTSVAISPDCRNLISGDYDNNVKIWSIYQ